MSLINHSSTINKFEQWLFPKIIGYVNHYFFTWGELKLFSAERTSVSLLYGRNKYDSDDVFILDIPYLLHLHLNVKRSDVFLINKKTFLYGFYYQKGERLYYGFGKERVTDLTRKN